MLCRPGGSQESERSDGERRSAMIQLTLDRNASLSELARQTGRDDPKVLRELIDRHFEDLARITATLDRRYDEIKSAG